MGFERFGVKSFTSHTKLTAFVDYLEKGELRATKCKNCGKVYFPPRADCARCLNSDIEWVLIEGEGTLISYTCANYAPTGFEADVPYVLALADFNGVKVFGRLKGDVPVDDIKVGMTVKTVINSLPGDRLTYEFAPS